MTSFSAKRRSPPRRIVIVVYHGVTLLDATGPAEVFGTASNADAGGPPAYRVVLASADGGMVTTDGGVALGTVSLNQAAAEPIDTLLVAGGNGVFEVMHDTTLVNWIAREGPRARRCGSTCLGAFLLAAAGLLDGRRVVTHWRWCDRLRAEFPDLAVEDDPIFIQDGTLWSSAGVSAGMDMALAMVDEDEGHALALEVARRLVVYLKRPGGQSQFSETLKAQGTDSNGGSGALDQLPVWMRANLACDLRVERLAEVAGMSPRNFARVFTSRFGMTPAKAVEAMRIEVSKQQLVAQKTGIAEIARQCGFQDDERMRRAFLRHTGIAPLDYRRRFGVFA